jgi:hypothetical protein
MHGASLAEEWVDRAKEEAGISKLDSMATAQERLETLNAVRLVTRQREQYWLQAYIERIINTTPRPIFDCLIADTDSNPPVEEKVSPSSSFYEAHALQLGSFQRYKLYCPNSNNTSPLNRGDQIRCHLYRRYTNPTSYLLLPKDLDISTLPLELLLTNNNQKKKSSMENSINESLILDDD